MITYLSNLTKGLINLVYPLTCEICGIKINTDLNDACICKDCLKKMTMVSPVNPTEYNGVRVWSASAYEGVSKECIHLFKYKAKLHLAKPLSELMINFANNFLSIEKFDIIVPVPLHRNRLRERGFNQSELLSRGLAKSINRPVRLKALVRVKPTLAQAGLSKTKRFANLKGAFRVSDPSAVAGKNILLVDDVFTTGSTIAECAAALRKAGAKSVEALVLARGI